MTGRPGGLGIGDRVRFCGRDQVVIGVSGTSVRLADTAGEVVTVTVSGLLADGDFAVLDSRPRPGMPQVSVLDGLPAEAVEEARWWERHIVEVLTGVPPDAGEGAVPRPEYDPGPAPPGRYRMQALHSRPRHPAPVPVHLPAHQRLCIRHGIWLPGPKTPQFSVRGCPDILDAERRARRLLRQCAIEQLVYSTVQNPGEAGEQAWKRRATALIESNPRSAAESSPQEMFLAAAYPDAIAAAQARSKRFREQSSLTETILADH